MLAPGFFFARTGRPGFHRRTTHREARMIPPGIIKFFTGLWTLRDETGATPVRYSVYFFDQLPGQPVIYCNYCELGTADHRTVGVTLWLHGQEEKSKY
jgi:hypothetical protein